VHKSLQAHSHTHAHTCVVAVVVDGRVIYINTRTHLRCYCCGCWESHLQKHTHTCVVTVVVVGRGADAVLVPHATAKVGGAASTVVGLGGGQASTAGVLLLGLCMYVGVI